MGRALFGLAAVVVAVFGAPRPADAHAFLVRTEPAQGARLTAAPQSVALQFSEGVADQGATVAVQIGGGRPAALRVERQSGGAVLRAALIDRQAGIYVVHWHVVATDGHESEGEFAFAVGRVGGSLPSSAATSRGASAIDVVGSWLFFLGLAVGAGGLLVVLAVDRRLVPRLVSVRAGLLAASLGAGLVYLHTVLASTGAVSTREALGSGVAVALLSVAVLTITWMPRLWMAGLPVLGAAVAWSAKGHGATDSGAVGFAVDATHLIAGALWVGALGHFVVGLLRRRDERDELLVAGRSYARVALGLVVVLAAAGGVSALRLLPRLSDLWTTGYGRLLIAKTALFGLALALAFVARRFGLGRGSVTRLRLVTPVEAGAAAAVLLLTGVLVNVAPPAPAHAAATLLGPPPLAGAVLRSAGPAGILTVAVAAGDGQLQVEVIPPGGPAPGARADIDAELPDGRETTVVGRPCGPGCFTEKMVLPNGHTRLTVTASAPGWKGGTYTAELDWPPPAEDPALLRALLSRMRAVATVQVTERTSSGPDSVVQPVDFSLTGDQFVGTEPYAGGDAEDVQPLAGPEHGLRLYVAGDRIWVTVWLDGQGRIARERIVDVGHLIDRTFRYPTP